MFCVIISKRSICNCSAQQSLNAGGGGGGATGLTTSSISGKPGSNVRFESTFLSCCKFRYDIHIADNRRAVAAAVLEANALVVLADLTLSMTPEAEVLSIHN